MSADEPTRLTTTRPLLLLGVGQPSTRAVRHVEDCAGNGDCVQGGQDRAQALVDAVAAAEVAQHPAVHAQCAGGARGARFEDAKAKYRAVRVEQRPLVCGGQVIDGGHESGGGVPSRRITVEMSEPLGEGRVELAAQGGDYGETLGIRPAPPQRPARSRCRGHRCPPARALQLLEPGPMGGDGLGEVGHMRPLLIDADLAVVMTGRLDLAPHQQVDEVNLHLEIGVMHLLPGREIGGVFQTHVTSKSNASMLSAPLTRTLTG